jgi:hypothetical protein
MSTQYTDMMQLCSKTWPTDSGLLKEALAAARKYPEREALLNSLLKEVREALECKMQLHYAIWRWRSDRNMDYIETEWPCDRDNLTAVVTGLSEKEHDRLYSLYILASEGKETKVTLDKMVVDLVLEQRLAEQQAAAKAAAEVAEAACDGVTAEEAEEIWSQIQEDRKKPPRRYSFHDLQRALGVLPPKDELVRWTEEDYREHCAPVEWPEQEEPTCHYCHPSSGCDGDHGDECRDGFGPIYKGRIPSSPLTLPAPTVLSASEQEEVDEWTRDIQRLIAESKAIREAPDSAFASLELEEEIEVDINEV